ncbi:MAG: Phenylalanine-tRNA ligase beta subunit [Candidatus Moranbacteria bacterium GW2011_GWF2_36_839]|nr:MAG: Phenylalanine-tRNA ligase beta subunit [Candidatus Moranbacteria bacterium GW2011_GWF1_36_78]KKQ17792.1 MAG: Phenylalanine-tRNA ligase beta subunit [Candidatus Moranbacteria bacterium GW2011_GWF2_36_839]HAT73494.1 phenylalanine--tRNA ligase subunit beta [Candidatus Moranbacteria bacterium]HBY10856.1 phenylalanine--tRNA ligase subunit beta [Candidatus Moranbacteria bacterium]
MKYSYNWLKELSDTKLSQDIVRELLTMHSLEIEGMEEKKWNFDGVVVGKILEIRKHPNADKLQIAIVETQNFASVQKQNLQIVCGAPNIEVGQKVPVALVGTKLPNGIEIKEAEIRGEKSFGMLCALDELGLGADHSGIFILDSKAKIGEPAKKYLGVEDDTIFEIKVLPDRAHDATSHVGVAREISVLENKNFEYDFDGLKLPNKKSKKLIVKIEDRKLCSRYIGAVMENVEIKDSPSWMKQRLEASGIRPINNVVDATNYVMLELGQPMHAFDFSKISGQETRNKKQETNKIQIVVRKAKENEEMELLDETKLKLSDQDLLITNGETPLALAGIMGGKDSGINENTKTIILEAANFDAVNIRRSRTRLGVKTESSDRFEKEIDPNLAEKAIVRIIEVLEHTADAKLEGVIDVYPNKIKPCKIKLDLEYVNSLLGEIIPKKEIIRILNLLGIGTTIQPYKVVCIVPTFRVDLKTQEDLIEEIGRIWGYEKIEPRPLVEPIIPAKINEVLSFERRLGEISVGFGFDEMYNYSFYSEIDAKNCALDNVKHFELSSPMNPDQKYVRVSLIPNILKNIKTNLKNFESLNIFEIGKVYLCHPELVSGSGFRNEFRMTGTEEKRMFVMAQVLEKDPVNFAEAKHGASKNAETFYSIKGATENLLEKISVDENSISFNEVKLSKNHLAHAGRSAEILVDGEKIGMIGEINPLVLGKYKIGKRVAVCELDTEKLLKISQKELVYKALQKFPTITRDISMLAKGETKAIEIQKLIKKIGGDLVLNVSMFDVFFKDGVTSFAYHIEFGAPERTLENKEVDEVMGKIVAGLEKELGLEIRK